MNKFSINITTEKGNHTIEFDNIAKLVKFCIGAPVYHLKLLNKEDYEEIEHICAIALGQMKNK